MPRIRLAMVTAFPPGRQSLNEYGWHLALALAKHPNVAELVVLADRLEDGTADLDPADLPANLTLKRVWRFNSLGAAPCLLRCLSQQEPDGVIWNLQMGSFGDREVPAALGLLAPALARIGRPSGVIAHNILAGMDLDKTQLQGQRLRQAVVRAGAAVVTRAMLAASYTTVTLRSYRDLLGARYPQARVDLVPHGTFAQAPRRPVPLSSRPPRIVTMGKFGTYKRLETLLEAFDILRQGPGFADVELHVGGGDHPAMPGYVAGIAASRQDDPRVRFHGYLPENQIEDFFSQARLAVFDYSATTGSSGVLHQAASLGAVPVFPHIGDFVDVCRDEGLGGAHFTPDDAADMARAIAGMLTDADSAQALADSNLAASAQMPIADVAAYHVRRMIALQPIGSSACPSGQQGDCPKG